MDLEKNLKKLRIITLIESAVILIAVIVVLFSGVLQTTGETLLTQSKSDNGRYTISIYEVGKPSIIRKNTVKAYYSDADHREGTAVFTAEVDNGMAVLTGSNYELKWEGDTAVLYLVGNKQTGTEYKINFDTVKNP